MSLRPPRYSRRWSPGDSFATTVQTAAGSTAAFTLPGSKRDGPEDYVLGCFVADRVLEGVLREPRPGQMLRRDRHQTAKVPGARGRGSRLSTIWKVRCFESSG